MRNTIIKVAYKLGYTMGRILRIFKPVEPKKTSRTDIFTDEEIMVLLDIVLLDELNSQENN